MNSGALPLAGFKVIELGHIVAGPTAGQMLADLGADVIKIEKPGTGDYLRTMPGPVVALFSFLNRNKRSVALDLKTEAGKAACLDMARSADVVIDNFSFGAMDRAGVGYEAVSRINPGVVWLSIKGFLPGGPLEAMPMLDELAQVGGGLAFMTGQPGQPMRAGASIIDIAVAVYGVVGVQAALLQRAANGGKGQKITSGLFETTATFMAQWMAAAQFTGAPSRPMQETRRDSRGGFPVYRLFGTADGSQIFIAIVSAAHWERFCKAFDRPDLHTDPRFVDAEAQRANRPALYAEIEAMIRKYTLAEAAALLQGELLPSTPLHRPDELATHAHLVASGQLMDVVMPDGRTGRAPKLPFQSTAFDMSVRMPAPGVGEHTREVLLAMGYTEEKIAALVSAGAVTAQSKAAPG